MKERLKISLDVCIPPTLSRVTMKMDLFEISREFSKIGSIGTKKKNCDWILLGNVGNVQLVGNNTLARIFMDFYAEICWTRKILGVLI